MVRGRVATTYEWLSVSNSLKPTKPLIWGSGQAIRFVLVNAVFNNAVQLQRPCLRAGRPNCSNNTSGGIVAHFPHLRSPSGIKLLVSTHRMPLQQSLGNIKALAMVYRTSLSKQRFNLGECSASSPSNRVACPPSIPQTGPRSTRSHYHIFDLLSIITRQPAANTA